MLGPVSGTCRLRGRHPKRPQPSPWWGKNGSRGQSWTKRGGTAGAEAGAVFPLGTEDSEAMEADATVWAGWTRLQDKCPAVKDSGSGVRTV